MNLVISILDRFSDVAMAAGLTGEDVFIIFLLVLVGTMGKIVLGALTK